MGLRVTPNVSPPASQTNTGCQCGGKGLLQSWAGFAIIMSRRAVCSSRGEPGLWLSIANEANGKVFTKKPPRPLPWSIVLALGSPWWGKSSWNQGRAVSQCPGKKKPWSLWMLLAASCCWSWVGLRVVGDKWRQAGNGVPHSSSRCSQPKSRNSGEK